MLTAYSARFSRPLAIAAAVIAIGLPLPSASLAADPAEVAAQALDDQLENARREAVLRENVGQAAAVVAAMTKDLPKDAKEEYRRIPWIWRISIAAGRENNEQVLRDLVLVSLPAEDEPLTDWQAVVLGGGVINGLTHAGVWPRERIAELLKEPAEKQRWKRALELASKMAEDAKVPSGTRYDALRMLGVGTWEQYGEQITKYLAKDAHPELQMGAVSAAGDVQDPQAARALLDALPHLTEGNRKLALEALVRDDERRKQLRAAIDAGQVKTEWLTDELRSQLD